MGSNFTDLKKRTMEITDEQIKELKTLLWVLDSKHNVSVPQTQENINYISGEIVKLFSIPGVSKSVAKQYAEFCVRLDRKGLPLLELDDYIKQYWC